MRTVLVGAAILLCLSLSTIGYAQNSTLGGTVGDATGALIPGVAVKATNVATGILSSTITNETGTYNFGSVQPGVYKVSAELPGFQTQTRTDVQIAASTQIRLNFTLTVATLSQAVEVSVGADVLLAESAASVGNVLPEYKIRDLPIVGNNVLDLINTMAGVTGTGANVNFAGVSGLQVNTVRDGLSVSDGRFNNGVFATTIMNPDLVGEIRVILAPVDAELGRGNGQVQVQTRSGTNTYTGAAVWNIRNTALNSNTWANNRNIDPGTGRWSPTPTDWQNNHEYTVSYGGPIIKNKTFFFALWDQQINLRRATITGSVLTDAARQGIFRYFDAWNNGNSDSTTTGTGTNPTTAVVDFQGNPLRPRTNPGANQDPATNPFTGNLKCFSVFGNIKADNTPFTAADCPGGAAVINSIAWDPLRLTTDSTGYIRRILDIMPKANYFATGDGLNAAGFRWTLRRHGSPGGANVTQGLQTDVDRKQINVKVDHNFNSNNKLAVGWSYERNATDSDTPNWPGGLSYVTGRYPQVLTTNFTSTLSSTMLNEARFGIRYNKAGVDAPFELSSTQAEANKWMLPGTKGYTALVSPGAVVAGGTQSFQFGGTLNGIFNTNPGQYNGNTSHLYNYADTVSWTLGKHAFKAGGELRLTKTNGYNNVAGGGVVFPFPTIQGGAGNNISQLNTPGNTPTLPAASLITTSRTNAVNMLYFLAGSVNTVQQLYWIDDANDVANGHWEDVTTAPNGRKYRDTVENEWSGFFKDDWKITRDLTLNLGIRYDFYGSPYIGSGFTSTSRDQGDGLWGAFRTAGGDPFTRWLRPGNLFLTGYGPNASTAAALVCALPSCDPSKLTVTEFIGPNTPNPDKVAVPKDRNNFGPALGFAWRLPWFGEGKTTLRGGYQLTYGGSGRVVGGGFSNTTEFIIGNAPGANSIASTTNYIAELNNQYLDLSNVTPLIPARPTAPVLPGGTLPVYARSNYTSYDANYVTPYTQNFTLSATRNVRQNITVDVRYVGTVSRKQEGQINLNTSNIYHNTELFNAIDAARKGQDPVLLDQMLAGLNLNTNVTGTYGPVGTVFNGVVQTGAMHLRRAQATAMANGDYLAVANFLAGNGANLPATGQPGGLQSLPAGLSGVQGRVLRNGCDRLAANFTTVGIANPTPLRCFSEDYIFANPQLGATSAIGGFAALLTNTGYSNYHSMQAQVTLRPTRGFSYQATYSWAKNLGIPNGTTAFTDPSDRSTDYTLTAADRRHDFRSNSTFELPIGPNKLLLANSSGWLARLVERWQTSMIINVTSGGPATIAASGGLYANPVPDVVGPFDISNAGVRWDAANNAAGTAHGGTYFGAPSPYVRVDDPQCATVNYTDQAGFNLFTNGSCTIDAIADAKTGQIVLRNPQPGVRGNLGQRSIFLPGTWNFDANLSKAFRISESKTLQLRVDATNVLNHPNPNDPNLSLLGGANNTPFGEITTKGNQTRQFQGQLRFTF